MSNLLRSIRRVGYFRPVGRNDPRGGAPDPSVQLISSVFGLECPPESMVGVTSARTMEMITRGHEDELMEEIYDNASLSKEQFEEEGCDLVGVIVNRVGREGFDETLRFLCGKSADAGISFAGAIPEDQIPAKPRMDEIAAALDAEVLYGAKYLDNLVDNLRIASMQLPSLLDRIGPGSLVITAGDGGDILQERSRPRCRIVCRSWPASF